MAQGTGIITELRLEPEGLSARITYPPGLRPAPGQYLLASSPDLSDPLPVVLFPTRINQDNLIAAPPLPPTWTAGMHLLLRGPLGSGFQLPPSARRVALASLDASPARLLPLAYQALNQGAAVTVYTHMIPSGLPPEVEILPLDLLHEAQSWADFMALEMQLPALREARASLGLGPYTRPNCPIQVLVITPMPCSGIGTCGVCSVSTRDGWKLACTDGPVFDFRVLEVV